MDICFETSSLVIGVTGHRDLRDEDIAQLTAAVADVFDQLERRYAKPRSFLQRMRRIVRSATGRPPGVTPMVVLSSLAEGADQLAARVAVGRGLRVVAPLPLPVEEYRRDFELTPIRPGALTDFDAWMTRPGIEKFFVGEPDGSSKDDQPPSRWRKLQYRRAGVFVLRHCDILVALWDGRSSTPIGGTAEIVGFRRHGIPRDADGGEGLDVTVMGPVIHIVTPRAAKADTAKAVSVECWGAGPLRHALAVARRRPSVTPAEIAALEHDYGLWKSFEALRHR
jgi:hypothetical protein